jgi:hypothetical protein
MIRWYSTPHDDARHGLDHPTIENAFTDLNAFKGSLAVMYTRLALNSGLIIFGQSTEPWAHFE